MRGLGDTDVSDSGLRFDELGSGDSKTFGIPGHWTLELLKKLYKSKS